MLESCANLQSLFNTAYRKAFFNILCNIALLADLWSLFYLVANACYLMLTNEGKASLLSLVTKRRYRNLQSYLPNQNFKTLLAIKVSKNQKQIFQAKLLPKNKPTNLFFYPDKQSGQKNTFVGLYFGRTFGWKLCFYFLPTFSRYQSQGTTVVGTLVNDIRIMKSFEAHCSGMNL